MTIWEYDDMAAFERAIGVLSTDPAFARFVAAWLEDFGGRVVNLDEIGIEHFLLVTAGHLDDE